jgi:uncharacterized protein with PIN domain
MGTKFIVDAMLGSVARWLRLLGYDTVYERDMADWKILKISQAEHRVLVTRDKGLYHRAKKNGAECIFIQPGMNTLDTLALIVRTYRLEIDTELNGSRCVNCNGTLNLIGSNKWKCSKCGKEYWKGSHWYTMRTTLIRLERLVEQDGDSGPSRTGPRGWKGAGEGSQGVHRDEVKWKEGGDRDQESAPPQERDGIRNSGNVLRRHH